MIACPTRQTPMRAHLDCRQQRWIEVYEITGHPRRVIRDGVLILGLALGGRPHRRFIQRR